MMHSASAYAIQLAQHLPTGPAWPRDRDSMLMRLVDQEAIEFARIDLRIEQFADETDPRTAYEMLEDWERVLGLPDPCTSAAISVPARQAACWRKLAYVAGQTPAFYTALAAAIGYEVQIHEFDPDVDDYDGSLTGAIGGGRYRYVARFDVLNAGSFRYFRVGDPVGGRLVDGDDFPIDLECVLNAAKPAHTLFIFSYPEDGIETPADAPVVEDFGPVAIAYQTATGIDVASHVTGTWTLIHAGNGAKGTTSVAGSVITYTPGAGQYGADSFTYAAEGPGGYSTARTISVTIANPPAPVASDVTGILVGYETSEPISLSGAITGVYTSIAAGNGAHGTTIVTGSTVTYTPATGYSGADSFSFSATGPGGTSATKTVSLIVGAPGTGGGGGTGGGEVGGD